MRDTESSFILYVLFRWGNTGQRLEQVVHAGTVICRPYMYTMWITRILLSPHLLKVFFFFLTNDIGGERLHKYLLGAWRFRTLNKGEKKKKEKVGLS